MGPTLASFSTGFDSPLSELDEQNRSLLRTSRISAGTISPAAKLIKSPKTTSFVGNSWSWPSRRIFVVTDTICSSEFTASFVFTFWTKEVNPEISTMVNIIMTVLRSFWLAGTKISSVKSESVAKISNTTVNGVKKASAKKVSLECCWLDAISLLPYCSRRLAASVSLSPSSLAWSLAKTSVRLTVAIVFTSCKSTCATLCLGVLLKNILYSFPQTNKKAPHITVSGSKPNKASN